MCLLYVHKCLHEEGNDVFSPYEVINYRTRLADSNSLTIPGVRHLWNTLPSRIREIISYETFKFNIKKLLLLEQN